VVEPKFENRRRMPAVFSRAHDNNYVGGARLVACALPPDSYRERDEIPERKHGQDECRQTGYALEVRYSYVNIVARIELLTSAANPLLKDLRRAIARGSLTDDGWCVAESFHLLEEALRSERNVRVVLASESVKTTVERHVGGLRGTRTLVLPDRLFQTIAATETSQGVIALVEPPQWSIDQLFRGQSLVIVLDGLQDPGNAGAIARAAEAFGATGLMFVKGTVGPFHPKTLRASAGSLFRIPFVSGLDAPLARASLKQRRVDLYAAMPFTGSERFAGDIDFSRKCAIVIGSEGRGVSKELQGIATDVAIPTVGVESLNAAVAASVLLYEARRQRVREAVSV
jgi:RNA methyltransferase, TrmH family